MLSSQVTIMFFKGRPNGYLRIIGDPSLLDGLTKSMKLIRPTGRPKAIQATVMR
jgi:hypothetical protein